MKKEDKEENIPETNWTRSRKMLVFEDSPNWKKMTSTRNLGKIIFFPQTFSMSRNLQGHLVIRSRSERLFQLLIALQISMRLRDTLGMILRASWQPHFSKTAHATWPSKWRFFNMARPLWPNLSSAIAQGYVVSTHKRSDNLRCVKEIHELVIRKVLHNFPTWRGPSGRIYRVQCCPYTQTQWQSAICKRWKVTNRYIEKGGAVSRNPKNRDKPLYFW